MEILCHLGHRGIQKRSVNLLEKISPFLDKTILGITIGNQIFSKLGIELYSYSQWDKILDCFSQEGLVDLDKEVDLFSWQGNQVNNLEILESFPLPSYKKNLLVHHVSHIKLI